MVYRPVIPCYRTGRQTGRAMEINMYRYTHGYTGIAILRVHVYAGTGSLLFFLEERAAKSVSVSM